MAASMGSGKGPGAHYEACPSALAPEPGERELYESQHRAVDRGLHHAALVYRPLEVTEAEALETSSQGYVRRG